MIGTEQHIVSDGESLMTLESFFGPSKAPKVISPSAASVPSLVAKTSLSTVGEGLSEEEAVLISSRLAKQQEKVREFHRKLDKIRSVYDFLTAEEVFEGLKMFLEDEDRVLVELTKAETVGMIRKAVALKYATSNMAQNDIVDVQRTIRKDRAQSSVKKGFITTNRRRKVYQCDKRLRLDDAVAQLNKSEDLECAMAGWSSARIRAFKALKEKPNTYYYRFNAPGEQQRNGTWTKEEHESFMKRLADVGADGNWGIFSMTIPGRVGYQCANYYRKQIELRKVTDDNYVLDQKGKAHFVFGTKSREALVQRSDDEESPRQPKRLKKKSPVSDSKPDDERSTSSTIPESDADVDFKDKAGHHYVLTNPLPGFVDVITQLEVVRPAISPYGHVLSYDTWLKCLCTGDRRNMCPFTNQPLHKRQLVLLTEDNSAIYQDVIKFIQ